MTSCSCGFDKAHPRSYFPSFSPTSITRDLVFFAVEFLLACPPHRVLG